jgi:hypothetical protein
LEKTLQHDQATQFTGVSSTSTKCIHPASGCQCLSGAKLTQHWHTHWGLVTHTVRIYRTTLSEVRKVVGNNPLQKLTVQHIQKFLGKKKPLVSEAHTSSIGIPLLCRTSASRNLPMICSAVCRCLPIKPSCRPKILILRTSPSIMSRGTGHFLLTLSFKKGLGCRLCCILRKSLEPPDDYDNSIYGKRN